MDLSDVVKKQIMETFIESIDIIADEEFQKRVWIEGRGPECHSYDDFVNYFFNTSESILSKYISFNITDNQMKILKNFHDTLEDFNCKNSYEPQDFISSTDWKKIIEIAKKVLNSFNYRKKSASHKSVKNIEQLNEQDQSLS